MKATHPFTWLSQGRPHAGTHAHTTSEKHALFLRSSGGVFFIGCLYQLWSIKIFVYWKYYHTMQQSWYLSMWSNLWSAKRRLPLSMSSPFMYFGVLNGTITMFSMTNSHWCKEKWSKLVWIQTWLYDDFYWRTTNFLYKENDVFCRTVPQSKKEKNTWWLISDKLHNMIMIWSHSRNQG